MKRKIILTLAIGLLSHLGFAQDFDRTKLDNFFNALETNNRFMGSVAVSKEGDIIYTKTIGFSDIENNIKANEKSKYRIGSITKTFTAVLIFKAVEKEKLSLDQTIDKFFPSVKMLIKSTPKTTNVIHTDLRTIGSLRQRRICPIHVVQGELFQHQVIWLNSVTLCLVES